MNDNNEPKVRRGERLRISAATMNNIVDAAKDHKRNRYNPRNVFNDVVPSHLIKSKTEVLIKNISDYGPSESFHVMKLDFPILEITEDIHHVNRRIGFNGNIVERTIDAIAILQNPLEIGDIGVGMVSGLSIVRVKLLDITHEWANPVVGVTRYMASAPCGQARILAYSNSDKPEDIADGVGIAIVNLIGYMCGNEVAYDPIINVCPIFEGSGSTFVGLKIERINALGVIYCEEVRSPDDCCPEGSSGGGTTYPPMEFSTNCASLLREFTTDAKISKTRFSLGR